MRIAAIILGVLALLASAGGIFAYWIGSAFICVDVCPPVSFASQQLPVLAAFTLGPGILLSLAAWILSLLYVRSQGRWTFFIALIVTPVAVAIAVALILYLAGGSFTPVANAGPSDVAPANAGRSPQTGSMSPATRSCHCSSGRLSRSSRRCCDPRDHRTRR